MSMKQNEALGRRFEEAYSTGNTADVSEFIAPGFIQHGSSIVPEFSGPEGYRRSVQEIRASFPDLQVTIDDMVVTDDKVAVRYHARGTHRGEFDGSPPTGRQVETMGIDILRIAAGKITEAWSMLDTLSLAEQVGAVQRLRAGEPATQPR